MKLSKFGSVALASVALTILGCGKKSKSDGAKITVNPKSPIVITGNIKIGRPGSELSIDGPWFKFTVKMDNQTEEEITVVAMMAKVTGSNQAGVFETNEVTIDPSSDDYSTDLLLCVYRHFGTFPPKNLENTDESDNSLYLPSTLNPAACIDGTKTFYIGGNPNPGVNGSYHYTGKMTLLGWFGTYDDPTDRFEKDVYFVTQ